ncbi:putative ribonuclease H-like domain-containing protein, partial [Tanacetum coccineum]
VYLGFLFNNMYSFDIKNFNKEIENLVDKKVKIIRSDNEIEFKNKVMDDFYREKGIKREYSVARTPQQNGVAERRNRTLIEAAKTMLADSKLPTTFWAEAVSTAYYVQNRVLVVKPYNKTPYELFRSFKPALSFMRPFGCHVTILNTLDSLGKFDGKNDEVAAGTITNESAGTQGELNAGTSTQKEEITQDCIVMPIWKDASYFDSPSKDVGNGEPKSVADDQKKVEDGPDNKNDEKDKSEDDSSPKKANTARQDVNTASPEVTIGHFKLNIVDPSVNTTSSFDPDSPKYMFTMGASHALKPTHVEFFSDEDEPEVDLGNIINSYTVPPTPNTRIHKDHPITNVIGDVWKLVDLPNGKRAIGTKWVFKNKKDERGIVIRNKARIEAIRLFLAYASFMGFLVYQMDVKSAFLYGTIEEEVYVNDIIFGSINKELCTGFEKLMKDKFQINEILKKFNYTDVKTASTPVDLEKPLVKDGDANDVDVHLYRSMIGSLMYLTSSRPHIMFAVCACARFQVTPKTSHLLAIKRIFRYLKGKPTLGLWYSKDSPFELVAYTDSDYVGATQDRKSTTGGYLLTKGFDAGRHVKRGRDTKIPQSSGPPIKVSDEDVRKELGDNMERVVNRTQSMETLNGSNP